MSAWATPCSNPSARGFNTIGKLLPALGAGAGLSPEEQQRLVSGAKSLRTPDEVASYVWDYLDRQGR